MPDADHGHAFPTDDALCERCGYPLRGLAIEAACPECGLAVAESSPAKRVGPIYQTRPRLRFFLPTAALMLFFPRACYRRMRIDGGNGPARRFLILVCVLVGMFWMLTGGGVLDSPRTTLEVHFVAALLGVYALTYIEMLGVTAFSRRRGWRVPLRLAERVCCYASVGWLPGVLLAGGGVWLLEVYASDRRWFESLVGLVRVSWMLYAGLFVLSLLWFETLVWLGVRQVRYANAPPTDPQPPKPAVPLKRDGTP